MPASFAPPRANAEIEVAGMKALHIPIRVVLYRDEQSWVAHCLEFDLLGDGETRPDALARLEEAVALQVAASVDGNNVANLFKPADGRFFAMFAAGTGSGVAAGGLRVRHDPVTVGEAEVREYAGSDADDIGRVVA